MSPALSPLLSVLLALSLSRPACSQSAVGVTVDEVDVNGTFTASPTATPAPEWETSTSAGNSTVLFTEGTVFKSTWSSDNHSLVVTQGHESRQSTPVIPEVNATSQVILLQTTGPSVHAVTDERTTNGTSPAETTSHSTDVSNTSSTVTGALLMVTTKTPVVADDASSTVTVIESSSGAAATTEQSAVSAEGNTTSRGNGTVERRDVPVVLLLTFNGTCDYDSSSIAGQLEGLVEGAEAAGCESQVRLRLSVSNVSDLNHLVGVLRLQTHGSVLTLSAVEFPDRSQAAGTAEEDLVTRLFAGPFSTREIITYAVVGGVFGVAIILVAALLCCKCCCSDGRRKRSQDIPHLTLRLEDYSLTRIPRPNTLFGGGGAATVLRNGAPEGSRVRQSIDTSVVPIEEDLGSLRRGGLRSFSGRRIANRGEEEDGHSRGSPALTGSTERLARDFGNRQQKRGNENKNFRF